MEIEVLIDRDAFIAEMKAKQWEWGYARSELEDYFLILVHENGEENYGKLARDRIVRKLNLRRAFKLLKNLPGYRWVEIRKL